MPGILLISIKCGGNELLQLALRPGKTGGDGGEDMSAQSALAGQFRPYLLRRAVDIVLLQIRISESSLAMRKDSP